MVAEHTEEHSSAAARRSSVDVFNNLLALILLIASSTLIADFTHRLIAADADKVGILSIIVQISMAVVASSAFTRRGMALIDGPLNSARGRHLKSLFRLALAAFCFALTLPSWIFLPPLLARHYSTRGDTLKKDGQFAQAIHYYERAIALDPTPQYFYVNAGVMLEQFYRYDAAEEQYRKAIVANRADPVPYNDLARMLILDTKPAAALKVVGDGLALPSPAPEVTAGLLKNKAWAEFLEGFVQAATVDAEQSQIEQKKAHNPNAAEATCLLGKIYGKLGKATQARAEWRLFLVESKQSVTGQPAIEPDCQLTAEVVNAKN